MILALETSTHITSVALQVEDNQFELVDDSGTKATETILDLIMQLLGEQKVSVKELAAIAFSAGPGAFTGVRLAASVTQGLAFVNQTPVLPISSLQISAQKAYETFAATSVLVAHDARRQEIYTNAYRFKNGIMQANAADKMLSPNMIEVPEGDWIGVGNGFAEYQNDFSPHVLARLKKVETMFYPSAKAMLSLSKYFLQHNQQLAPEHALPIYLRSPLG